MRKEEIRIECDCGHKGHFFVLDRWGGDDEILWAAVCEAGRNLPLLTRIKYAFQYIWGDTHLNYTEVLFRKKDLKKLKKLLKEI